MAFHCPPAGSRFSNGRRFASAWSLTVVALFSVSVQAGYSEIDVQALPTEVADGDATGSGNGTLDFILFTHETAQNQGTGFNFDDANTNVATGGKTTYAESFVTSGADLKAFYDLNFGTLDESGNPIEGSGAQFIQEIVIFLDLNETNPSAADNVLEKMEVILNPDSIQGVTTDPVTGDVPSSQQNAINQGASGGTLEADTSGPQDIPQLAQGGG